MAEPGIASLMRTHPIERVHLYVREDSPEASRLAERAVRYLSEHGVEMLREPSPVEPRPGAIVMAVGGDGTLLKAYHDSRGTLPLIGVKDGTYGLLMELDEGNLHKGLKRLVEGDYEVVTHPAVRLEGVPVSPALNEVLLACGIRGKASKFSVYVGEAFVNSFIADGLIFATPLGSMAYSLSAGGPLVDPRVQALVAAPLAAWPPSMIVPVTSFVAPMNIEVRVESNRDLVGIIDGQVEVPLQREARIRLVRDGPRFARMYPEPEGFYGRIVERAGRWSARKNVK